MINTLEAPSPFLSTFADFKPSGATLLCNRLSPRPLTAKLHGYSVG